MSALTAAGSPPESTGAAASQANSTSLAAANSSSINSTSAASNTSSQQMHVCGLCDKLLSSSSSLDRHMLTHSGERPFVCKRCHMTFTTNGNMHRHMRTHLHKDSIARQQQQQELQLKSSSSLDSNPLNQHQHQPDSQQQQQQLASRPPPPPPALSSGGELGSLHLDTGAGPPPLINTFPGAASAAAEHLGSTPHPAALVDALNFLAADPYMGPAAPVSVSAAAAAAAAAAAVAAVQRAGDMQANPLSAFLNQLLVAASNFRHIKSSLEAGSQQQQHQQPAQLSASAAAAALALNQQLSPNIINHNNNNYLSMVDSPEPLDSDLNAGYLTDSPQPPLEPLSLANSPQPLGPSASLSLLGSPQPLPTALQLKHLHHNHHQPHHHQHHNQIHHQTATTTTTTTTTTSTTNMCLDSPQQASMASSSASSAPNSPRPNSLAAIMDSPSRHASLLSTLNSPHPGSLSMDSPQPVSLSTNNSHTTTLGQELDDAAGDIVEDISQSYVKTANPNAARKGGKRNRHCYKCKLCTYSSVDRCTLVRHLRIHSGERPYICGICRYAFTTKANCERHVRKRHKRQYNSLGGPGGGGIKGSNGGGRSLIITDHSNHQTIPVKVNPVAAQTISQTLQSIQDKQQQQQQHQQQQQQQQPFFIGRNPFDAFSAADLAAQALDLSCKFQSSK